MRGKVLLLSLLWLLGCGGDHTPSASELWCSGLCAAVVRCGSSETEGDCRVRCQSERPTLARLSTQGADGVGACLRDMACSDLFGPVDAWHAAYDACWQGAKLTLHSTAHVRAFCASFALAEFDCGYFYAIDECEKDFGMWSDSVRDQVATCTMRPGCDDSDACISSTFGGP